MKLNGIFAKKWIKMPTHLFAFVRFFYYYLIKNIYREMLLCNTSIYQTEWHFEKIVTRTRHICCYFTVFLISTCKKLWVSNAFIRLSNGDIWFQWKNAKLSCVEKLWHEWHKPRALEVLNSHEEKEEGKGDTKFGRKKGHRKWQRW